MSVSGLSKSNQNYLKAVWVLGEWSNVPVTATLIASRVGVRLSTASDAIKKLTEKGLLEHARYGSVKLSTEGRAHAVEMVRRHRLIETFLVEALDYRWDQVHDEAEQLENAVSDLLVERIDAYLGHPTRDPHGDPIPSPDGAVERPDASPLSEAEPGARVRVERVSDSDPALLEFLAGHGVVFGAELKIRPAAPYSDAVELVATADGATLSIGKSAADAVWVSDLA
ncbi:metal-dependent transcriptional regulator [Gulosibacter molinativorax]|uniref:Manganese transport regulator n=1 Tax=Gulosibacter molinativorax TaxID=256821 RepID=A0ABT7C881_9MICO|nr:metal-dependent transcriptional regulator [Gulosibacter molinativorax]MDJ1371426.1 metal-dependent transcriptional regulator [Gulosibacter molinativorax]QUY62924.1 Iron dependent repressor DNA binding domain protein [Gulosibacter molinativorax]